MLEVCCYVVGAKCRNAWVLTNRLCLDQYIRTLQAEGIVFDIKVIQALAQGVVRAHRPETEHLSASPDWANKFTKGHEFGLRRCDDCAVVGLAATDAISTTIQLESNEQEVIRENTWRETYNPVVSNPRRFGIPWDGAIVEDLRLAMDEEPLQYVAKSDGDYSKKKRVVERQATTEGVSWPHWEWEGASHAGNHPWKVNEVLGARRCNRPEHCPDVGREDDADTPNLYCCAAPDCVSLDGDQESPGPPCVRTLNCPDGLGSLPQQRLPRTTGGGGGECAPPDGEGDPSHAGFFWYSPEVSTMQFRGSVAKSQHEEVHP